ncbi:MAG: ATP-dependent helicase [Ruminococcaceae bacterium]|nr:ATP-dependent helicase [Oscillospiraceae bacterium]
MNVYEQTKQPYQQYKTTYNLTLSPEQDLACQTVNGHVLLLAVPGSGKTTAVIARLGYMVKGLGIDPSSILAVTYSVAGAKEMQKRYEALFGSRDVEIRTINGFCAALIHRYERVKGREAFRLLDKESDVSLILRGILADTGGYPTENEIRDVRTAITYCRNSMLTEEEIKDKIKIEGRDFLDIYRRYRSYKTENRLMDYDDQLAYGYKILCTCPEVNACYTDRFRYLCVDEAQDTSKIQHLILRKAAEKHGNLFMVGDEDQSIYGFRAAYPEGLLEFDTVYPDAKVLSIGQNYRSTRTIVEAAGRFIALNRDRRAADKAMTTANEAGEPILHTVLPDRKRLPDHIRRVATTMEGSTAVLSRLNDSLLPLIDVLSENGIPYRVRGNDGLFFSHYIVTDIAAILRFAADPFDGELFRQLYYKFSCGMSRADCESALRENRGPDMLSYPEYIAETMFYPERLRKRMRRLAGVLYRINRADTYEAIRLILSDSGYGTYLSHRTKDTTKTAVLLAIADRHRTRKSFFDRLVTLEEEVKRGAVSREGILLTTIHSAKGMEFDRVLLCDCENGVLPSVTAPANGTAYTAEEQATVEEERRLFYVGITRAKKRLELVTWDKAFGEETEGFDYVRILLNEPRSADEALKTVPKTARKGPKSARNLPPKVPKSADEIEKLMERYYEGVSVGHKAFGEGVVIGRRGHFVQVQFAGLRFPKKLDLTVCLENDLMWEL